MQMTDPDKHATEVRCNCIKNLYRMFDNLSLGASFPTLARYDKNGVFNGTFCLTEPGGPRVISVLSSLWHKYSFVINTE